MHEKMEPKCYWSEGVNLCKGKKVIKMVTKTVINKQKNTTNLWLNDSF